MRAFIKSIGRYDYILIVINLCLLTQLFISYKLWEPKHRTFPLISAIPAISIKLGTTWDLFLFNLIIASLIGMLFSKLRKIAFILLFLSLTLLILEDIVRLQPWIYIFTLMLFCICFNSYTETGLLRIKISIIAILAGTYLWSGIQKLNVAFGQEIMPWLMSPIISEEFMRENFYLAYIAAIAEIFAGVGLLVEKFRKPAIIVAIIIHLFLLYLLGPFGHSWNIVIWPWNLAMILILLIIFFDPLKIEFISVKRYYFTYLILLLVFILPLFNFVGLWDNHLSGSLYSGNNPEAIFYFDEKDRTRLPDLKPFTFFYPDTKVEFIMLDQWCIGDVDAPFYPEERYFKILGKKLCDCIQDKERAGIRIAVKKKFSSSESLKNYNCKELK
jgi:hypothetical protein